MMGSVVQRLVRECTWRGWLAAAVLVWWIPGYASSIELGGNPTQGGLVIGKVPAGTRITVDGNPVRVSTAGDFILGFGRDAKSSARLEAVFGDGRTETRDVEIKRRTYRVQRIDGLPPRKVTPPAEELERIAREVDLVKRTRKRDDPRTDFLKGFAWPVLGPISGVYGSQRILNGKPRRPHYGVDIAAPAGTPVAAAADGIVTLAHPDMYFSGATLIIDHGHGLSSVYMHLSKITVPEGKRVKRGDVVGAVGASGRASGAHLHWGLNWFQTRLDPQLLVEEMPAQTARH